MLDPNYQRPDPFFDAVLQRPHMTSEGGCDLPILYRDGSLLGMFYRVDPALAREVLPDSRVEPFVIFGKAIVLVASFEYRATSIGPYGEFGIGVVCKKSGSSPSVIKYAMDMIGAKDTGIMVVNLPVTDAGAKAAGIDIWGYPKYVTRITTKFHKAGVEIGLDGELRITSTQPQSRGLKTKGMPFVTFTTHPSGRLVRTVITFDSDVRWGGAGKTRLKVTGDGPSARTARALGLDQRAPSFMFRTDRLRAVLPEGELQP